MFTERAERIIGEMAKANIPQMVISDPVAIDYLLGHRFSPGERLIALCLFQGGGHKLVINRLFPMEKNLGVELVWYDDVDDSAAVLAGLLDKNAVCGIDKNLPSGFLIRLLDLNAAAGYVNGSLIVDSVRQVKDEREKELMRMSSRLNDGVISRLIPMTAMGYAETELGQKCLELFKEAGFDDINLHPITAYGKNGADPHHGSDDTRGKRGDCVVIDIGSSKDGYFCDMTRTVFLGEVSDRAREIYNIVLEANLRGIAAAKPGARMCDVDKAARDYITEKGFGKYFTHRTGHSIGMEVHEAGDVSAVNTAVIRTGQCFSIEPGIYLPDEGIGVRIEDLVLITEDGCEVLNSYPKDLIVVPME